MITITSDNQCYDLYHNLLGSSRLKHSAVFDYNIFQSIINYLNDINQSISSENIQLDFLLCFLNSLLSDPNIYNELQNPKSSLFSIRKTLHETFQLLFTNLNQSSRRKCAYRNKFWNILVKLLDPNEDQITDQFLDYVLESNQLSVQQLTFLHKFCNSKQAKSSRKLDKKLLKRLVEQFMSGVEIQSKNVFGEDREFVVSSVDYLKFRMIQEKIEESNRKEMTLENEMKDEKSIWNLMSKNPDGLEQIYRPPSSISNASNTNESCGKQPTFLIKTTLPQVECELLLKIIGKIISLRQDLGLYLSTQNGQFLTIIFKTNLKRSSLIRLKIPTIDIFITLSKLNLICRQGQNGRSVKDLDQSLISILVSIITGNNLAEEIKFQDKIKASRILSEFLKLKQNMCKFTISCERLSDCLQKMIKQDRGTERSEKSTKTKDLYQSSGAKENEWDSLEVGLQLLSVLTSSEDCTRLLLYKEDKDLNDLGQTLDKTLIKFRHPCLIPINVRKKVLSVICSLSKSSHNLRNMLSNLKISNFIIEWIKFDITEPIAEKTKINLFSGQFQSGNLNADGSEVSESQKLEKLDQVVQYLIYNLDQLMDIDLYLQYINIVGNLLLEFNPGKTELLKSGILTWLKFNTYNKDKTKLIKYKSLSALTNATYNASSATLEKVLNELTFDHLLKLAKEEDRIVILEVLALLRNFTCGDNFNAHLGLSKSTTINQLIKNFRENQGLKKANLKTKPLMSSSSSNNHQQMSEQLANIFRESLQNQQNSKLTQSSSNMSDISENDTSILVRHHSKIMEILEFIIERVARFETNIEKTPAPDNNQKFLNFTSKQINLSAKQDISAMKVQTVKILSNLSTLKAASDSIVDKKSNILQFLIDGSRINHKNDGQYESTHLSYYQDMLNNPIFGPSILTLCEIYENTQSIIIRVRLEQCLLEMTNNNSSSRLADDIKEVEKLEKKLDAIVENPDENSLNQNNKNIDNSSAQSFLAQNWAELAEKIRSDGIFDLSDTKNGKKDLHENSVIFVDRAKRITQQELVGRIKRVTTKENMI